MFTNSGQHVLYSDSSGLNLCGVERSRALDTKWQFASLLT
jgi:hypothetical protein